MIEKVSCRAERAIQRARSQVPMNSDLNDLARPNDSFNSTKQGLGAFYGWRVPFWRRKLLSAVKISSASAINKVTKITIRYRLIGADGSGRFSISADGSAHFGISSIL